jgi:hypothetical protein
MIVSHTRKFIFIKSAKTAGTSLEAALSNYCSGADIVTPLGDYEFNRDETGRWVHRAMNADGFEQHDWGVTIRDKVGLAVWNEYFKFSIARNPWDRVVSLFTWKARKDPARSADRDGGGRASGAEVDLEAIREKFAEFVRQGNWQTNDRFYVIDGQCCADFVIRYETLAEGTLELCRRLGIAPIELPRLKSGFKPGQFHYSQYYDADSEAIVAERHANDIRLFGYRFERA